MKIIISAIFVSMIGVTHASNFIYINGRMVNVEITPPQFPSNRDECDTFQTSAREILEDIISAHDECIKTRGGSDGTSNYLGSISQEPTEQRCSVSTCQSLHTARDTLQGKISGGYATCLRSVALANDQPRYGSSSTREDELENMDSKILSGPLSVARRYVRNSLSDAISQAFGMNSGFVSRGINSAAITSHLWNKTEALLEECEGKRDVSRRREACVEEVRQTLNELVSRVPGRYRGDPAVGLIQRSMLERLYQIQGQAFYEMEKLQEDMNSISTESVPTIPTRSAPRTRSRGIIENR